MRPRLWQPLATFATIFACASNHHRPVNTPPPTPQEKPTPIAKTAQVDSTCDAQQSKKISVGDAAFVHVCGGPRFLVYEVTPQSLLEELDIASGCRLAFIGRQRGRAFVKLWRASDPAGTPPDKTICIDVE